MQELDLVLEEEFLDLLAVMVREMPSEELWQMPSTPSASSGASELGVHGSSVLAVCTTARLWIGAALEVLTWSLLSGQPTAHFALQEGHCRNLYGVLRHAQLLW